MQSIDVSGSLDVAEQAPRRRIVLTPSQRARATHFSSNDYLGLAQHPQVIAAFQQAAARYGVGGESSTLVAGYTDIHREFEQAFASFVGRPAAVLYATGYMANCGVVSVLADNSRPVIADKFIHASLVDAIRLSSATLHRYPHNNVARAESLLGEHPNALLITDSVFSMHGDLAPLDQLASLAQQHQATLLVDDAHGIGVLGAHGAGAAEHFQLDANRLPVLVCPLAKAFGVMGAMVAGSESLIDRLVQHSRAYIYTSALPPALAAAGLCSLALIRQETWRREHLQALIAFTQQRARALSLPIATSNSPIQPIRVSTSAQAVWLSEQLTQRGFLLKAMRPPTVPPRDICLRVSLTALHEMSDIEHLLVTLRSLFDVMPA